MSDLTINDFRRTSVDWLELSNELRQRSDAIEELLLVSDNNGQIEGAIALLGCQYYIHHEALHGSVLQRRVWEAGIQGPIQSLIGAGVKVDLVNEAARQVYSTVLGIELS